MLYPGARFDATASRTCRGALPPSAREATLLRVAVRLGRPGVIGMTLMDVVAWVLLGSVAGWLAGHLVGDHELGPVGTIVLGITGAVAGGFLAAVLGLPSGGAELASVNLLSALVAVIGAVLVAAGASVAIGRRPAV